MNISQSGARWVIHQLQQRAIIVSYSTIDNILTNLLPAGLQDFFQVLNVSNDDDDKQAVGVFPRSNSPLGLGLDCSVANFLLPQILAYKDAKTQLFVVNDELAHRK